jgi:hypothetical protein
MIETANAITSQVSARSSTPTILAIMKNAISMPLLIKNSFRPPVMRSRLNQQFFHCVL